VVEEQPAGDGPTLRAFFPEAVPASPLEARVRAYLSSLGALGLAVLAEPTISALADGNWAEAWREHFRPLAVGRRFLVAPPWDVPRAPDRMVLIIEPGRAFGTGHHGSTAGCLDLLEAALDGERLPCAIDLGTGSGILAVAAARLGVARTIAVDEDPDAIAAATANAERNGVAAEIECRLGDVATLDLEPAPLVLANLLTAAHLKMAARYRRLLAHGGVLVLGGILDAEAGAVRDVVREQGLVPTVTSSIDGWSALGFRAPVHDRA
jgi:ribosomal protein L11 methyltransferase